MKGTLITLLVFCSIVTSAQAEPLSARIIFTYAIESNVPIYVRDEGPPYRESGLRLDLHKEWSTGLYFDLIPYLWNTSGDRVGNGGAILMIGWMARNIGIQFVHESRHNFDRPSKGGHLEWDAIEVIWQLK